MQGFQASYHRAKCKKKVGGSLLLTITRVCSYSSSKLHVSFLEILDWFSAATLVARGVNSPSFDGDLQYTPEGLQAGGFSVSVFAPGFRNPYDVRQKHNVVSYCSSHIDHSQASCFTLL